MTSTKPTQGPALPTINEIRDQHRRLLNLCSDFQGLPEVAEDRRTMLFLFEETLRLLTANFRKQEAFMEQIGYPQAENHRWLHAVLIGNASSLTTAYQRGQSGFKETVRALHSAILEHLTGPDAELIRAGRE